MGKICDFCRFVGLRWHDKDTKFHKELLKLSRVVSLGYRQMHTHEQQGNP
jgi:hypothetical protein